MTLLGTIVATAHLLHIDEPHVAGAAAFVGIVSTVLAVTVSPKSPQASALGIIIASNLAILYAALYIGAWIVPICFSTLAASALLLRWGNSLLVATALTWTTSFAVIFPGVLTNIHPLGEPVLNVHLISLSVVSCCVLWFARIVDVKERAVLREYDRAQNADAAKTELLARVSHELRTPLSTVLGYLDLAHQGLREGHAVRPYVTTASRNSRHLLSLIDDLIEITQDEVLERTLIEVSLAPLLEEVLEVASSQATGSPLIVRHEFLSDAMPAKLSTDPQVLRRILGNLLSNAISHTREGEVCLSAELRGAGEERELLLSVRDTGLGIAPDHQARVFDAFFSTDSSDKAGTGLGLSVSQRLARSLGGELFLAHSELGVGSTFTLRLPAHEPVGEPTQPEPEQEETVDLKGLRCLVVDDNPELSALLQMVLEMHGAEVVLAENGAVALDRATGVDLIFMDLDMPVLDGLSATRILRERGFSNTITALTAHVMPQDEARCRDAGADHYLRKPISMEQILAHAQQVFIRTNTGP